MRCSRVAEIENRDRFVAERPSRKDVEFHNRKTMDSKDVFYCVNYHCGEDATASAKVWLESLTELRADARHAVVSEPSGGNADFPYAR